MDRPGAGTTTLRRARADDVPAIESLMAESMRVLFPAFYDAEQTASSVRHFASLDRILIADGTYLVIEAGGVLVACRGWTRRERVPHGSEGEPRIFDPETEPARIRQMFVRPEWTRKGLATRLLEAGEAAAREAGYRRLELGATLAGEPVYLRFGFREIERIDIPLPDGLSIAGVLMAKPI